MFNELAAFILALLFAMFLVHVVQGAAGQNTGGLQWFKSFFSKADSSQGSSGPLPTNKPSGNASS